MEDFFGSEDIFLACANDRVNPEDLELDFEGKLTTINVYLQSQSTLSFSECCSVRPASCCSNYDSPERKQLVSLV